MTSLRFIGDLALWQGALLALAVGVFAWVLYYRETRGLSGAVRWILPTCRACAIMLALLVLTAPVLHHRYREGEPGRLRFLIDGSRSMSITDKQLSSDAKLEIARSLGWIEQSTSAAATSAPTVPDSAAGNGNSSEAIDRFDRSSRLTRGLDRLLVADGGMLDALRDEFEIVVERFDRTRQSLWESTLDKSPPLPDDPARWLPESFVNATQLGTALAGSTITMGVNSDASSKAAADNANKSPATGQEEVVTALAGGSEETVVLFSDGRNTSGVSPLVVAENLAAQHRAVYVVGFGGTQTPDDVLLATVESPERVFERDMLRGTMVVRSRMQKPSPLRLMIKHAGEVVWEETRTLTTSERGRVDFAFPVKPIVDKLKKEAGRQVDLSSVPLHLEASVEPQEGEADTSNNSRSFHLSVVTKRSRLLLCDGRSRWETRYLHNMFERDPAWQVDIVLPDYRESPPRLPRGTEANQWPSTKERMLEYDLIILGELPANIIPRESLDWLKMFVESSGGGLIVIDGSRGALRDPLYKNVQSMLPIEWVEDKRIRTDPTHLQLTAAAKQMSVFQLTPLDPAKNESAWAELPPLHIAATVKALPGSEVLAMVSPEGDDLPLMVTRQYGAGRIFYSATDETWRWRYKMADTYHQRFWNQVGRWVMRLPMSVQSQFVSIDSGKLVYQPGESITIRTRLRNDQGEPAVGLTVEAQITGVDAESAQAQVGAPGSESRAGGPGNGGTQARGLGYGTQAGGLGYEGSQAGGLGYGRVIAAVPLLADPSIPGVYAGQIQAPASGSYHVSIIAPGLSSAALAVHSEFTVAEPDAGEMDQLSCDEVLLKKVAEETGGKYLSEAQAHELVDLLRPLSRGKIVESDSLLWQSYWWFAPIVLLLSIEWWLRKRAGLI